MDHSYSTEREKVQKTDHSYFTVAKKTPKVVLRKAQLMKEQQDMNRTSIGQDHSYVRSDHLLQQDFASIDAVNDEDYCLSVISAPTHQSHMEKNEHFFSIPSTACTKPSCVLSQAPESSICDLDNIDTQISGIKLDHAYDLKLNISTSRRSTVSSLQSEMMNQAVICYDPTLRLRLHDHTYLGRSAMKIVDKA